MSVPPQALPLGQIRKDLEKNFPSLILSEEKDTYIILGTYDLRQEGKWIATYRLRIVLPDDYPYSIPQFYETGNRIPRTLDNHINGNGTLCLGVTEQIWLDLGGQFELLPLLKRHVRSYLIGATNMLKGKGWPYGERSHGPEGICEFYGEKIGNTCPFAVLNLILFLTRPIAKGHHNCPCGSGRRLRDCHRDNVRELHQKKLPHKMLVNSGMFIVKKIQTENSLKPGHEQKLENICRQLSKFEQ